MAFICGVFDILLVVERASRSPYPIFHPTKAPLMYNVASAIYVLCPLVELASAYVSYLLFKDADDWEARTTLPNPFGGVYVYRAIQLKEVVLLTQPGLSGANFRQAACR